MQTSDVERQFRQRASKRDLDLNEHPAREGIEALVAFYREARASDVDVDDDGDMLLFQWGTYDRGDGDYFELNLTRQLTTTEGGDENTWQLSLTYRFEPTDDVEDIDVGHQWCQHPEELDDFVEDIYSSEPFKAVEDLSADEIELSLETMG